jgi:hypothetical protein
MEMLTKVLMAEKEEAFKNTILYTFKSEASGSS